jgi:hypothetical protein
MSSITRSGSPDGAKSPPLSSYRDVTGAADARFEEPEDEQGWIFYARDGDQVVAATRMSWGGNGFSQRQIDQYQLRPFLDEIPADRMAVGERNTVLPSYRGTGVLDTLMMELLPQIVQHDLRLVFGCCEPHLLTLYVKMGQRTYAQQNINSPAAGYLIPLVSFIPTARAKHHRLISSLRTRSVLSACRHAARRLARGATAAPTGPRCSTARTPCPPRLITLRGSRDGEVDRCPVRGK